MLFDLKGRRKRFIQVTYLILAVLFGGGLVFFGVGSDVQGGLLDALSGGGGGRGSGAQTYKDQVSRYQRRVKLDPKDERAWVNLAEAQFNLARSGDGYDPETGQFTEDAHGALDRATHAWERYLALEPRNPDPGAANLMFQAYGGLITVGSGSPLVAFEAALRAQEIIAEARPSAITFFNVATISYQIGKIGKGDRAADEAVRRTPKDQRNVVRSQLKSARKEGVKTKKELRKAEKQAERAAREARKSGQDPFGGPPGQAPLGP